jgi:hypothetical protein
LRNGTPAAAGGTARAAVRLSIIDPAPSDHQSGDAPFVRGDDRAGDPGAIPDDEEGEAFPGGEVGPR